MKNMTEVERVKTNFEQSVKNIVSARAEDEKVSLEILSHAAVEIALELAILNDYLKGKTMGYQPNVVNKGDVLLINGRRFEAIKDFNAQKDSVLKLRLIKHEKPRTILVIDEGENNEQCESGASTSD